MLVSQGTPQSSWRARSVRALVLLSLAAGALTGVAAAPAQAAGPEMGPATALSVYGANAAGRMRPPPELTDFRTVVADVSAGSDHALAVTDLGTLFAWGDDSDDAGRVPLDIAAAGPFRAVSAGDDVSLAVTKTGAVKSWGALTDVGGRYRVPADFPTTGIVDVSVGGTHVLALRSDGFLLSWGDESWGQREIPAEMQGKRVVKFAAGGAFSVAVTEDNRVYVFGLGENGVMKPPAALQGQPIEEIEAGLNHVVALTTDGRLFTWGANDWGQLNVTAGYERWAHVSAGSNVTVAYPLTGSGELGAPQVWGENAGTLYAQRPHLDETIPLVEAGDGFVIYGLSRLLSLTSGEITGTPRVGDVLSATPATYKPLPATGTTIEWYDGSTLVGTGTTFVPGPGLLNKTLSMYTVGTRAGYHVPRVPAGTVKVLPGRLSATIPTIAGRARVGQVLTASVVATPTPDRSVYSWYADGVRRQVDETTTYTVLPGDVDKRITVQVAVHRDGYDSINTELSAQTAPVQDAQVFQVSKDVAINGSGQVGQPLTVVPPVAQPTPDHIAYQWYRGGQKLDGQTATVYTPVAADRGQSLQVRATLTKTDYDAKEVTSPSVTVSAGAFTTVGQPTITGQALVGQSLTAAVAASPAPDAVGYDWYVGGALRVSNGAATYSPTSTDLGQAVTVRATVRRDGFENGVSALSAPTGAVAVPQVAVVSGARVTGRAVAGSVLSAVPPTTSVDGNVSYQWLRSGKAISGARSATLRLGAGDVGKRMSVQVTVARDGWTSAISTSSATSATTKATPAVRASVRGAGKRTVVAVRASAAGLPALRAKVVVRVGKVVKRVALAKGRAVVTLPRTKKRIAITVGSTVTTSARTIRVLGK